MITEPLRKNRGTTLSVWLRWLRQEGWIVLSPLVAAIALLVCLLTTGCAQLVRFADGEAYYNYPVGRQKGHPYKATKTVWDDWFLAPAHVYGWWGMKSYDPIGHSILTIMWPFSLIDLPCEAAFDTLMCVPDLILADPNPNKTRKE